MSVTVAQIREGLAANLAGIAGVQVSAYMLANPTPPTIHVYPGQIEYDGAMIRGVDRWTMIVQAFVGLVSDIGAQVKLDTFIAPSGAGSVKAGLEADRTLGGLVQSLRVTECSGERVYVREGAGPVLGAEWQVQILASGA
jgi:hypothetical protein